MEAYHSSYSSSSTIREARVAQNLDSSLHSVRKPSVKPWNKKPVAPLPPKRPKVYKVDPIDFRDLVQKLTGAPAPPQQPQPQPQPQQQPQRLRSLAPPPLKKEEIERPYSPPSEAKAQENGGTATSPFGFDLLSPSWFAFPILSPRSLSGLEQSTVS